MPDNTWGGYLDDPENRAQAYFGYGNQWKTPNQKDYFKQQFGNIQNQYMGALGRQVMGGGEPTLQFTDFLKQFNWGQNFQEQGPQQDTSRYNPFTRWNI